MRSTTGTTDDELTRQRFEVEIAQLIPWLPPRSDRMIAIGRGLDRWASALGTCARRVSAYELDPGRLQLLQSRIRRDRLWNVAAAPIVAASELEAECADLLFVSNVSSGLGDREFRDLSAGMAEWLRPGGRMVQRDFVSISARCEMRRRAVASGEALVVVYRDAAEIRSTHVRNGFVPVHETFMGSERAAERWHPDIRLRLGVYDRSR